MIEKTYIVFPMKRIAASIYDLFLLLGVWFAVGSIALWLNGGEILNPWLGLVIVFMSSWSFYAYFWMNGNKTLGMAVWNIEIYSITGNKVTLLQALKRFCCNIIIVMALGIPLLQIYFTKEKIAFNDIVSGTRLRIN